MTVRLLHADLDAAARPADPPRRIARRRQVRAAHPGGLDAGPADRRARRRATRPPDRRPLGARRGGSRAADPDARPARRERPRVGRRGARAVRSRDGRRSAGVLRRHARRSCSGRRPVSALSSLQELPSNLVAFQHRTASIGEGAELRWALAQLGSRLVRSRVDNRLEGDRSSVEQVEIVFGGSTISCST